MERGTRAGSDSRLMLLVTAVGIASAAIITIVVVERRVGVPAEDGSPAAAPGDLPITPSYSELGGVRRGPNAATYAGLAAELVDGVPRDSVSDRRQRAEAVARRAERRAYDGAPPRVPHAVTERDLDCVGCHGSGAELAGRVAPPMSHDPLPSCTQCHVPMVASLPGATQTPRFASNFEPLASRGPGTRAYEGAPPTIPHPTLMRERCATCHGPMGHRGLQTPHPYQVACTQCHAADRELDQRGRVP